MSHSQHRDIDVTCRGPQVGPYYTSQIGRPRRFAAGASNKCSCQSLDIRLDLPNFFATLQTGPTPSSGHRVTKGHPRRANVTRSVGPLNSPLRWGARPLPPSLKWPWQDNVQVPRCVNQPAGEVENLTPSATENWQTQDSSRNGSHKHAVAESIRLESMSRAGPGEKSGQLPTQILVPFRSEPAIP